MTHRAQQIVDAAAAILAASSTLEAAVYTHRRHPLSDPDQELPAVIVDYGADVPAGELGVTNVAFIDSLLELTVRIVVKGDTEADVLAAMLDRRVAQHVALMADRSLGLGFVIDTRYGGASEPVLDVSLERPAGELACRWLVHYRMNLADPSS